MLPSSPFRLNSGDIAGAFADAAMLLPLLAALSVSAGYDSTILLATAGLAYLAAGLVFRVPMAVQPLKSVAVAGLALGASGVEIQAAGLIVGLVCLLLAFAPVDRLAAMVPRRLIHGLQMGLGVLLMLKGASWGLGWPDGLHVSPAMLGFIALAALAICGSACLKLPGAAKAGLPMMGWMAVAGLLIALFTLPDAPITAQTNAAPGLPDARLLGVDTGILLALVLPQLALTLSNSVIGTMDVSARYFGAQAARRVTARRLLGSIGLGNLLAGAVGGLPYCHGAGGVTAHAQGGARHWQMNWVIGGTLLALAAGSWLLGRPLLPSLPLPLMAALLFATGWFHLTLAGPSWARPLNQPGLLLMAAIALITRNMLLVLLAGLAVEAISIAWRCR